jgi:hypothetical protein
VVKPGAVAAQDEREDQQVQFVEELFGEQPPDEGGAAADADLAVDLALELGDLLGEVAAEDPDQPNDRS